MLGKVEGQKKKARQAKTQPRSFQHSISHASDDLYKCLRRVCMIKISICRCGKSKRKLLKINPLPYLVKHPKN
jgi:hypothetical protein